MTAAAEEKLLGLQKLRQHKEDRQPGTEGLPTTRPAMEGLSRRCSQ